MDAPEPADRSADLAAALRDKPVSPTGTVACARLENKGKGKRMNKSELIEAVAADTGLTKTDSALVLESVLATVTKTLKKGDDVIITGFGKFSVVQRAARQGVNPRTGERVKIKASKAPKFSAGATLKQAVSPKKK
jgi:DNA-binding protein HU-beta